MSESKMKSYLIERLGELSDNRTDLNSKVYKTEIEVSKIDVKINQFKDEVDNIFEVFSPRHKSNDFAKDEVRCLEKRKEELLEEITINNQKIVSIDQEIEKINNAIDDNEDINEGLNKKSELANDKEFIDNSSDRAITMSVTYIEEQEEERARIAGELHDLPVQTLTNLVHKTEICSRILDTDPIRAKLELDIMGRALRDSINEMRTIIYNLRPMDVDDLGIDISLSRIINDCRSSSDCGNTNIGLSILGESYELTHVVALSIIRIVQEATNNAMKHAKANNIYISLKYLDRGINIIISDDGCGFDTGELTYHNSIKMTKFGLRMMKDRIKMLGGTIEISSTLQEGTKVRVFIPIT